MRLMTFGRRLAGAVLAAGLAGGTIAGAGLVAPDAAQAQNPAQGIPLTDDMVVRMIASYGEMIAEAETLRDRYQVPEAGGGDPGSAFLAFMAYQDAIGPLNDIATSHGFGGFTEWLQVVTSVAMAYAFAMEGGAADEQLAQAIEEIRNNPQIPAAQKEMMISQLQGSVAAMIAVRPPQENIDAVAPHAEELRAIFENN